VCNTQAQFNVEISFRFRISAADHCNYIPPTAWTRTTDLRGNPQEGPSAGTTVPTAPRYPPLPQLQNTTCLNNEDPDNMTLRMSTGDSINGNLQRNQELEFKVPVPRPSTDEVVLLGERVVPGRGTHTFLRRAITEFHEDCWWTKPMALALGYRRFGRSRINHIPPRNAVKFNLHL
jgi:hypothetical protein